MTMRLKMHSSAYRLQLISTLHKLDVIDRDERAYISYYYRRMVGEV